jgi:tetratricopeptide (TPR) repeat protein
LRSASARWWRLTLSSRETPWRLQREARDELPEAIERLVRSRVDRLGPRAHDAIVAASVLGVEFTLAALGSVAELDGDLLPALTELCSAHYLELAGEQAACAFANDEAVSSYRYALEQLAAGGRRQMERAAGVWSKLGQLFLRLRRYPEGRDALQQAGRLFPGSAAVGAADAYRLLSWIEVADRRRQAASEALDTADRLLEGAHDKEDDEWARTWVDVQLMRGFYYFYDDAELLGSVIARARPMVEERAGPKQRADFYTQVGYQRAAANRFTIDDDILDCFRDAWRVVVEAGLENDIETNFVRAGVGYFLVVKGDVLAGEEKLEAVLALAPRAGDRPMELTCLPCLAWARLRRHDVAGARELARQSASPDVALPFPFPEMARAVLAWAAWKEDRYSEVERLAEEVLGPKHSGEPTFPFSWICLWPLVAVRMAEGRTAEAMTAARELLRPPQVRLPSQLEGSLAAVLAAWEAGEHALASERLRNSVLLAEHLNFA